MVRLSLEEERAHRAVGFGAYLLTSVRQREQASLRARSRKGPRRKPTCGSRDARTLFPNGLRGVGVSIQKGITRQGRGTDCTHGYGYVLPRHCAIAICAGCY